MSAQLKIDEETGELLPQNVMEKAETAPAISIDISDVATYHNQPEKLVEIISNQAGFAVFDVSTKKGRDACKSHAANIIRCITPAANESKRLAADAKKVVNQDLSFRRDFESGIRALAEFHRKPLTEWEDDQERLKQEQIERENKRLEAEKYLSDWQDAIDFDELYTLRKSRELAEIKAEAERKAIEDKRLFDEAVARKAEEQRQAIEAAAKRKAEAEQAEKLEAERAKIRAEEQAKIAEEHRIKSEEDEAKAVSAIVNAKAEINRLAGIDQESKLIDFDDVAKMSQQDASFYEDEAEQEKEFFGAVEMVTIPKSEYDELLARSERLFVFEAEIENCPF